MYSVINANSFAKTQVLREQIVRLNGGDESIPFILVASKIDLVDNEHPRQISCEHGQTRADEFEVPYIETSALTNKNVKEAFHGLLEMIKSHRHETKMDTSSSSKSNEKKNTRNASCVVI